MKKWKGVKGICKASAKVSVLKSLTMGGGVKVVPTCVTSIMDDHMYNFNEYKNDFKSVSLLVVFYNQTSIIIFN